MRFHCLQHVPFEPPGLLIRWIGRQGYTVQTTFLFEDMGLPSLDDFDALIIMGGPMSVHDEAEFPWLRLEKDLIAAAIGAGKKVLGICMGAQLIAEVKGGRVYPNPEKEIGFFPVFWTDEARRMFPGEAGLDPAAEGLSPVAEGLGSGGGGLGSGGGFFHWHGETFDLPPGAVRLAYSAGCLNQAFRLGENVLGLQFHPEATSDIIGEMVRQEGYELIEGPYIQDAAEIIRRAKEITVGAGKGPTEAERQLDLLLNTFFN
ncbi:MAG TPA: type 1 glutamine amidotransferase [Puia sp.]|jgi:GMP synthase (glutamine-hydrolysing)